MAGCWTLSCVIQMQASKTNKLRQKCHRAMLNQLTIIPGCTYYDEAMPTFSQRYVLRSYNPNGSCSSLSSLAGYTTAVEKLGAVNPPKERTVLPGALHYTQFSVMRIKRSVLRRCDWRDRVDRTGSGQSLRAQHPSCPHDCRSLPLMYQPAC